MTVLELSKIIDKSPENTCYISIEDIFGYVFGLSIDWEVVEEFENKNGKRLVAYWVAPHYCTDSIVGERMYFFDGEPVAYSVQSGRKSSEEFYWISKDAATKVYRYGIEIMASRMPAVSYCSTKEDYGDSYKIEFISDVLDWSYARYHGQPISNVEIIKDKADYYAIWGKVKFATPDGEVHMVSVNELDFLYHTKMEELICQAMK